MIEKIEFIFFNGYINEKGYIVIMAETEGYLETNTHVVEHERVVHKLANDDLVRVKFAKDKSVHVFKYGLLKHFINIVNYINEHPKTKIIDGVTYHIARVSEIVEPAHFLWTLPWAEHHIDFPQYVAPPIDPEVEVLPDLTKPLPKKKEKIIDSTKYNRNDITPFDKDFIENNIKDKSGDPSNKEAYNEQMMTPVAYLMILANFLDNGYLACLCAKTIANNIHDFYTPDEARALYPIPDDVNVEKYFDTSEADEKALEIHDRCIAECKRAIENGAPNAIECLAEVERSRNYILNKGPTPNMLAVQEHRERFRQIAEFNNKRASETASTGAAAAAVPAIAAAAVATTGSAVATTGSAVATTGAAAAVPTTTKSTTD